MRCLLFVIDAAALLNSSSLVFEKQNTYLITPEVDAEIKDMKNRILLQQGIDAGLVSISEANEKFSEAARKKLVAINSKVSSADVSVLALSLQLKSEKKQFVVITDDYSVQNLLMKEKIKFEGVIRGGIKKTRVFGKK